MTTVHPLPIENGELEEVEEVGTTREALQKQRQPFDSGEPDFTSPVEVVDIPTVVNEPISKEQRLLKREAFVIESETSQVDETGSQSMKVNATATTTTAATTATVTEQPLPSPKPAAMTLGTEAESVASAVDDRGTVTRVEDQFQTTTTQQDFQRAGSEINYSRVASPGDHHGPAALGLEVLANVTKLYLHRIGLWECDWKGGKYAIYDGTTNDHLFYAREDAGCCGLCKLSVMTIMDSSNENEIIRIVRPFRCLFPYQRCFICCYGCTCWQSYRDEIQVESPPGRTISHIVERAFCQNVPYYEVQDAYGRPLLSVGKPVKSCRLFTEFHHCTADCTNTLCDLACCRDIQPFFPVYEAELAPAKMPTTQVTSPHHRKHQSNTQSSKPPQIVLVDETPIASIDKLWACKLRFIAGNDYEINCMHISLVSLFLLFLLLSVFPLTSSDRHEQSNKSGSFVYRTFHRKYHFPK